MAGLGAFAAIVVAAALVPLRDWLGSTNVALILAIVVVGRRHLRRPASPASSPRSPRHSRSTSSTRKPYLRLAIDDREDVIAAVLLLVMGVIVGELATLRLRRAATRSQVHAQGAAHLEDVAAVVAAGADLDEVWPVVPPVARRSARAGRSAASSRCRSTRRSRRLGARRPHRQRRRCTTSTVAASPCPPRASPCPVVAGGQQLGRLVLVPHAAPRHDSRAQRRVAVAPRRPAGRRRRPVPNPSTR